MLAQVEVVERACRQAVTVILKAVTILTRMTQRAAASRNQIGLWERIGQIHAVLQELMSACEGLLLELEHFTLHAGKVILIEPSRFVWF